MRGRGRLAWWLALAIGAGACGSDEPVAWLWLGDESFATSKGIVRTADDELVHAAAGDVSQLTWLGVDGHERMRLTLDPAAGSARFAALATDDTGNLYVAGSYTGTVDFGDGTAYTEEACTDILGCDDAFLASYDRDGALRWVRVYAQPGLDSLDHLAAANGAVVAVGTLGGRDTIDDDVGAEDVNRLFAVAVDAGGNELWQRLDDEDRLGWIQGVVAGAGGDTWVSAGVYGRTTSDRFLRRFDASGQDTRFDDLPPGKLAFAPGGDLVFLGGLSGANTFGDVTLTGGDQQPDLFVARYAPASMSYRWAVKLDGANSNYASDVVLDRAGRVLALGQGLVDSVATEPPPAEPGSLVLVTLDPDDGAVLDATSFGAEDTYWGRHILVTGDRDVVVTGNIDRGVGASETFVRRFEPFAR